MQAAGFGWNDGYRALVSDGSQHLIRVIGLVAHDRARGGEPGQPAGWVTAGYRPAPLRSGPGAGSCPARRLRRGIGCQSRRDCGRGLRLRPHFFLAGRGFVGFDRG